MVTHYDYLIVGAGFSGATLAERIATELPGKTVLIIDKRNHIGGNCYDEIDLETGILVSKYGAHLFHTNSPKVWEYVNRFSRWVRYDHKVLAQVGGTLVPVPVNQETINTVFNENLQTPEEVRTWLATKQILTPNPKNSEETALSRVGPELYELLFKPFTIKQWGKEPAELAPSVLARIPVRDTNDGRYFTDKYQGLPALGYTRIFERMLDHPNITIRLSTDFEDIKSEITWGSLIFTGRIDQYYKEAGLPSLEYRSLNFEVRRFYECPGFIQQGTVINYPSPDIPYTRSVEYKWLPYDYNTQLRTSTSIVVYETSCGCDEGAEPYYPVPNPANEALYEEYRALAAAEKNVHFIGRLASYKYFNMDQAIEAALNYFKDNIQLQPSWGEADSGEQDAHERAPHNHASS